MATDARRFLKEIADELPAKGEARRLLLEAIQKLNEIFPLDPNHLEVMQEPAELIRKACDLLDESRNKEKLQFFVVLTEYMAKGHNQAGSEPIN